MRFVALLLVVFAAYTNASPVCPGYAVCGSDEMTYENLCEWELATLLNPNLALLYLGPCKRVSHEEAFKALLHRTGDSNLLRSGSKRRESCSSSSNTNIRVKKKLSQKEAPDNDYSVDDELDTDLYSRLAELQFDFRRQPANNEDRDDIDDENLS